MDTQDIIKLTEDLVRINSISTSKNTKGEFNENLFADFLFNTLNHLKLKPQVKKIQDGRKCISVFLRGSSKRTIVLLAHHDTVGIEDYESNINPFDTQPVKDKTYLHGRGSGDMKSGIAVGIAVLEALKKTSLKTNVIFLSAPDEENNSAGMLSCVSYLSNLKNKEKLEFIGAINLDCVLQDETKPQSKTIIAGGSVGKLLPTFFVVGRAAHVSDPFEGISSNAIASEIIRELEGNTKYSNKSTVTQEVTPPPICLKFEDLKDEYNVQLPIKSYLYFNYLTFTETPRDVLTLMKTVAKKAVLQTLTNNLKNYNSYQQKLKKKSKLRTWDKQINVYTYQELFKNAQKQNPNIEKELTKLYEANKSQDIREQNIRLIEFLTSKSTFKGPYVICFFSPPFYPSSYAEQNTFITSVLSTIKQFGTDNHIEFIIRKISEGISDMNYLQVQQTAKNDLKEYENNNPVAQYSKELKMDNLINISMPITDIGPYALHPHESGEKVEIKYTFQDLPQLLIKIITNLQ